MKRDFDEEEVFEVVKGRALRHLSSRQRKTTNLHLDLRVHEAGETLGPRIQKIVLDEPGILVFADDNPRANFAHECRYLLFQPKDGELRKEVPARFPPFLNKRPESLVPFHEPVNTRPNPDSYYTIPFPRCPVFFPDGDRYAILYSGMSDTRHLNDLEFCYRMLVDNYYFDPKNIYVLNYDGTLNTKDGAPGKWPGDKTAYRIKVTGKGDRGAFQAAFKDLATKIGADDLLLIHTNNHGDYYGGQSYMCQYPSWDAYWANDFCADMGVLPKFRSLIVMMEQCNSGGFNSPVVTSSPAANTSIASAAISSESSYGSLDGNWDVFAYEWIAAQFGHNPDGSGLAYNPDSNFDGTVEAKEAYDYAKAEDTVDDPCYQQSSAAGGEIALSQRYSIWWVWCWIWKEIIIDYYEPWPPNPPDPEFYEKVRSILPELQKAVVPMLNKTVADARAQVAPQIRAALDKVFETRGERAER
jgi:hypothetical protein